MKKTHIDVENAIIIYLYGVHDIQIAVVNGIGSILHLECIEKIALSEYFLRAKCVERILSLCETYDINALIMEENKLFTDSIDKYPDPYVLRNVRLGYGIKVAIEDNFMKTIDNILELPR